MPPSASGARGDGDIPQPRVAQKGEGVCTCGKKWKCNFLHSPRPSDPRPAGPPQGWQGPGIETPQAASLALGTTADPFKRNVPFPRNGRTDNLDVGQIV